jgi:predicted deacetylase
MEAMSVIVSLSGINPATLTSCAELAAEFDVRQVPLSLLVRPHAPGAGAVRGWLAERQAAGDALLMHGFDHALVPLATTPVVPRLGPRAEFAALPAHEAGLRLRAGTNLLERAGLRVQAFAPPRWLASPGTVQALPRAGFTVCADATAVRDVRTKAVQQARVLGFGPGLRNEAWQCRTLLHGTMRAARRDQLVRLAVDTADLTRPKRRAALLEAVDAALAQRARPATYLSILGRASISA